MVQAHRPFELSEPDDRPVNSRAEAVVRGLEYRHFGAFRNALELYRRFGITEEFAGLANDAWMARDLRTCLDALREARNVRRLLHCANILEPYGAVAVEWVEMFRAAAAAVTKDEQPANADGPSDPASRS